MSYIFSLSILRLLSFILHRVLELSCVRARARFNFIIEFRNLRLSSVAKGKKRSMTYRREIGTVQLNGVARPHLSPLRANEVSWISISSRTFHPQKNFRRVPRQLQLNRQTGVKWKRWKLKSKQQQWRKISGKKKTSLTLFSVNKVWLAWRKKNTKVSATGVRQGEKLRKLQILCWRKRRLCDVWDWKISCIHCPTLLSFASKWCKYELHIFHFCHEKKRKKKKSSRFLSLSQLRGIFSHCSTPRFQFRVLLLLLERVARRGTSTIKWGVHKNTTLISPARLLNYFFLCFASLHFFPFFSLLTLTPRSWRNETEKQWEE